MKHPHNCFIVPLIFVLLATSIDAWWDEGHLLVAGVAKLQLTDHEIDALEFPLRQWENQYPGLSNIVTASVWPDHLKCQFDTPFCEGMKLYDALEIFNQWHYTSIIYNPQSIHLNCLLSELPLPGTGAVWALSELLDGIPGLPKDGRFDYSYSALKQSRPELEAVLHPNRHHSNVTFSHRPLSQFSWNLRLRLLLHIFGDIHQPLHAIEAFFRQFPRGDVGGNLIHVDVSDSSLIPRNVSVTNFHSLWDSCGGQLSESWPRLEEDEILNKAKDLSKQFPRSYFGSRLDASSFDDVANDSYNTAKDVVYGALDLDWESDRPFGELPFQPSERYIEKVQSVCQEQIVLGGYRLSEILKDIAKAIQSTEDMEDLNSRERDNSVPRSFAPPAGSPTISYPIKSTAPSSRITPIEKQQITSSFNHENGDPVVSPSSGEEDGLGWWNTIVILALCGISTVACWKWIILSRQLSLIQSNNPHVSLNDGNTMNGIPALGLLERPLMDESTLGTDSHF